MEKLLARLCFLPSDAAALHAPLVQSLMDKGIVPVTHDSLETSTVPLLIVSTALTEELRDVIASAAAQSISHIVAILLGEADVCADAQWNLIRAGADDVLVAQPGTWLAARLHEQIRRWKAVDDLVLSDQVASLAVGASAVWRETLRRVVEIARFSAGFVLLSGESGTGKQVLAELVHSLDAREHKGNLVTVDCTTLLPELAGSELFGHEKGAFTGAIASRDGAFALADGGTLFLDEVGELPLLLQGQLLRVLQEKEFKRVGGNGFFRTEFRLISATNRNLAEEVQRGRFRLDLFHRVVAFNVNLPPLRDRQDDVLPLFNQFLRELIPGKPPPGLDCAVSLYLRQRAYPGNVRELKQLATQMATHHVGVGPLTIGDIPQDERSSFDVRRLDWRDEKFEQAIMRAVESGAGLRSIGQEAETTAIRLALGLANGNLHRAAQKLRVTDRALQLRRAGERRLPDSRQLL
jgi:transcriptional regulator with GAF, ATPase, and Fis domain